jgi:hypothetical protein
MTVGEEFRRAEPDWKHECCFPGKCDHRNDSQSAAVCSLEDKTECEYFVPKEVKKPRF